MKNNSWMKNGGFYWEKAKVIADYGHDIAAHPQVVLKHLEAERLSQGEIVERYREKLLAALWSNEEIWLGKIWSHGENGKIVLSTLEKFYSGGEYTGKERQMVSELLKHNFLRQASIKPGEEVGTASLTLEIKTDLANVFEDVSGDRLRKKLLTKINETLETKWISEEEWIEALKYCTDDSFMGNVRTMLGNRRNKSQERILKLNNPTILLRFHQITMEGYRGSNSHNNHWVEEDGPKCTFCSEAIPGSQNFARPSVHMSCIPEYLKTKNTGMNEPYISYLRAVHDAMFPAKKT